MASNAPPTSSTPGKGKATAPPTSSAPGKGKATAPPTSSAPGKGKATVPDVAPNAQPTSSAPGKGKATAPDMASDAEAPFEYAQDQLSGLEWPKNRPDDQSWDTAAPTHGDDGVQMDPRSYDDRDLLKWIMYFIGPTTSDPHERANRALRLQRAAYNALREYWVSLGPEPLLRPHHLPGAFPLSYAVQTNAQVRQCISVPDRFDSEPFRAPYIEDIDLTGSDADGSTQEVSDDPDDPIVDDHTPYLYPDAEEAPRGRARRRPGNATSQPDHPPADTLRRSGRKPGEGLQQPGHAQTATPGRPPIETPKPTAKGKAKDKQRSPVKGKQRSPVKGKQRSLAEDRRPDETPAQALRRQCEYAVNGGDNLPESFTDLSLCHAMAAGGRKDFAVTLQLPFSPMAADPTPARIIEDMMPRLRGLTYRNGGRTYEESTIGSVGRFAFMITSIDVLDALKDAYAQTRQQGFLLAIDDRARNLAATKDPVPRDELDRISDLDEGATEALCESFRHARHQGFERHSIVSKIRDIEDALHVGRQYQAVSDAASAQPELYDHYARVLGRSQEPGKRSRGSSLIVEFMVYMLDGLRRGDDGYQQAATRLHNLRATGLTLQELSNGLTDGVFVLMALMKDWREPVKRIGWPLMRLVMAEVNSRAVGFWHCCKTLHSNFYLPVMTADDVPYRAAIETTPKNRFTQSTFSALLQPTDSNEPRSRRPPPYVFRPQPGAPSIPAHNQEIFELQGPKALEGDEGDYDDDDADSGIGIDYENEGEAVITNQADEGDADFADAMEVD